MYIYICHCIYQVRSPESYYIDLYRITRQLQGAHSPLGSPNDGNHLYMLIYPWYILISHPNCLEVSNTVDDTSNYVPKRPILGLLPKPSNTTRGKQWENWVTSNELEHTSKLMKSRNRRWMATSSMLSWRLFFSPPSTFCDHVRKEWTIKDWTKYACCTVQTLSAVSNAVPQRASNAMYMSHARWNGETRYFQSLLRMSPTGQFSRRILPTVAIGGASRQMGVSFVSGSDQERNKRVPVHSRLRTGCLCQDYQVTGGEVGGNQWADASPSSPGFHPKLAHSPITATASNVSSPRLHEVVGHLHLPSTRCFIPAPPSSPHPATRDTENIITTGGWTSRFKNMSNWGSSSQYIVEHVTKACRWSSNITTKRLKTLPSTAGSIYIYIRRPLPQQGERVRGEITSSKSVLHCCGVFSLR